MGWLTLFRGEKGLVEALPRRKWAGRGSSAAKMGWLTLFHGENGLVDALSPGSPSGIWAVPAPLDTALSPGSPGGIWAVPAPLDTAAKTGWSRLFRGENGLVDALPRRKWAG